MGPDPVEDLFARARVERGRTPAQPDDAARRARDRILMSGAQQRPSRFSAGRRVGRVGLAVIAVVVAVLFGVLSVAWPMPQSALALTPAPLTFTSGPTESDVLELLVQLRDPSVTAPVRGVISEKWAVAIDRDSGRITPAPPRIEKLTWNEDLSGRLLIVADEPFWAKDAHRHPGAAPVPEPGAVLSDTRFAPGELRVPLSTVPGDTPDQLLDVLHAYGLPDHYTSKDVVQALIRLLDVWTLSDAQHRELVAMLVSAPGVHVRGRTEDRSGRAVVAVEVQTRGSTLDTLLIAYDTGRIVGVESVAQKTEGSVPAGTVVFYQLWDTRN